MKKKSMLIIAILLMSIGFAAISTTLIINGNANVSENNEDFSVIFTAASIEGQDVYTTAVDDTKKIITFETSELKTLNQTSILTYEVTNNSSQYDANVIVTCVPKAGTTAKYTSIKNKLDNDVAVVKAKTSVNGTLTVTLNKTATESVSEEYTCKLEFTATERETLETTPVNYTIVNDTNNNGIADIGDEIQVKGTKENFYVISTGVESTVNALAKYNLNVGNNKIDGIEGIQNKNSIGWNSTGKSPYAGVIAFSNISGWEYKNNNDIDVQLYDGPVKTAINNYKNILVNITNIRLITKRELENLGCDSSINFCSNAPSWIYSTTYWVGTSLSSNANYVWDVASNSGFGSNPFDYDEHIGVRPVITIS